MTEQRSPGWYDDGQGRLRWWSGRGWTTHTQDQPTAVAPVLQTPGSGVTAPVPPTRSDRVSPRSGFRGRTLLFTAGAAAVLGMFVGIGVGAGGKGPAVDPTAGPEYVALQTRLTSAVSERDALKTKVDDAADQVAAMTDKQSEFDAASDALDARAKALDKREAKLDKKAKSLAKSASAATSAPKKSAQKAPVSVYFQNCDAARAAGAAPVHRGDPGYASHLDRDGDGVGCE